RPEQTARFDVHVPESDIARLDRQPQLLFPLAQVLLGLDLLGDIEPPAENPGHRALGAEHGRIDEVESPNLLDTAAARTEPDSGPSRPIGLARRVDVVEELEEALTSDVRKGL